MDEIPCESADNEEMKIHPPSHPLPVEIQQMEHSEKVCRYCGVSYLILHEFQRLQEHLQEVERQLEKERGSAERERAVREELQQAHSHLEELRTSILQKEERARGLDLQLCVVRREMKSVRTERDRVCAELESERAQLLLLRERYVQQQQVLKESLVLMKFSRGEMTSVKSQLSHFLENWENSRTLIQQSCISADVERARLQQEVGRLGAELGRLQGEVPDLKSCLDAAGQQMLQLENQVQTQKLLENQNQEALTVIQGLREEMKTLKINLQASTHESEHAKKLVGTMSVEKKELEDLWSRKSSEQNATIQRLSQDLREKEESWLSCQRRCEALQEQLLAWQQREEEVTRRLERAEGEMKDQKAARSALQQEREELKKSHAEDLEKLEKSFRVMLKAAEENSSKLKVCLQQKQTEYESQLKQRERELRREAEMELNIETQKNQELLDKYRSEHQQLQNKIPVLMRSATQELHEHLAALQERVKHQEEEMQRVRESASQREQQILQESRAGEAQLRSALLELQQRTQELNEAQRNMQKLTEGSAALEEEKSLLEETVRRECEEREELTSALTLAREQLLELKHPTTKPHEAQTLPRLSRSTVNHPDLSTSKPTPHHPHSHTRNHSTLSPQGPRQKHLGEWYSGRGVASWHGTSGAVPTLPKISKERVPLMNEPFKGIATVRKDKL